MNLSNLLAQIGLSDGQGNTSSMRVMLYIVILSVLAPAVFIAFATKTPLTITGTDLELIVAAFGAKAVQNQQEAIQPPSVPVQPPAAAPSAPKTVTT